MLFIDLFLCTLGMAETAASVVAIIMNHRLLFFDWFLKKGA